MTREETLKIIYVIKSTYPKTYEHFSEADFRAMTDTWTYLFDEYTYEQISIGLKIYLTTNVSGFPPVPAQLISYTKQQNPVREMSSGEAWNLVYKAISNSSYHSEEEFEKLPELCKKVVGSADNLKEMARMDISSITVESSNFKRNYENLAKRKAEYEKIPQKTRERLEMIQSKMLLEG